MGTYLVMVNNFRRGFHHKLLFILTFILPILLCLAIGLVKFDKTTIRLGILMSDTDPIKASDKEALYKLLEASKGIKYDKAKEKTLNTDLIAGKFHIILDYRESDAIDQFEIISYQNAENTVFLKNMLQKAFRNKEQIQLTENKKEALSVTERSMAVLLTLFMIFSSIHTSAIIRDRQSGMQKRYEFARRSGSGYILGYMLYNLIITCLQLLLCILVLTFIQKDFNLNIAEVFILTLIIAMISCIFSMSICLISSSEVQANIITSALTAVMSLLGGTFVAVEAMPALLRILSFASPISWVVELIRFLP